MNPDNNLIPTFGIAAGRFAADAAEDGRAPRRALPLVSVLICAHLWFLFVVAAPASAELRFPTPTFTGGYQMPTTGPVAPAKSHLWTAIDITALVAALGLAVYFVYYRRSRKLVFLLTVASLVYFGFIRRGCVCSIGSIQNVAFAAGHNGYVLPWIVGGFFILPIITTLFFGRVFCSAVCPLGAIQDVMLWRPQRLPGWIERTLGLFPFMYLGLSAILAFMGADFLICRYDPFVSLFRLQGPAHLLFLGGVFLVICMFLGRAYCRFICPLGAIFRLISPLASKRVTITPRECVDCKLCDNACPFGSIRAPTAGQRNPTRSRERAVLAALILAVPLWAVAFGLLGHRIGPAVARLDFRMKLAVLVDGEMKSKQRGLIDETANFWKSGEAPEKLFDRANVLRKKYQTGAAAFGAWVGIVIGVTLIAASVRKYREEWIADAGTCVACARCYKSCPVEQAMRTGRSVEELIEERKAAVNV